MIDFPVDTIFAEARKIFICTALLSQRKTPANPSLNGTTALLKILFDEGI